MTVFERAVYMACKAFITIMETSSGDGAIAPKQPPVNHTSAALDGPPVCPNHGKVMAKGQYGYYCQTKENNPELSNKRGYCNYQVKWLPDRPPHGVG